MTAMVAAHIAIVLHDFSGGGSERIAIRLGNAWAAQGRRVTFLCGSEGGELRYLVDAAPQVAPVTPETRRSLISRALLAWRLARMIDTLAIDMIFIPGNYHLPVAALLGRLRPRLPIVAKLSNPVRPPRSLRWHEMIAEHATAIALRRIAALVAMSASLADQAALAFPSAHITTIDEPVLGDGDSDGDTTPRADDDAAPTTIICAGRLVPQKNHAAALAAFARLDPALGARLTILGSGPLRDALGVRAAQLGIADRVTFAGFVPDIAPHLRAARLFLMTSRFEGYPAVLIEAMAAGLPIVTTDCSPAIAEIMANPGFGRVVERDDPADVAAAINEQWQAPPPDRNAVQAHVARHRLTASARAYLALFDRLVA